MVNLPREKILWNGIELSPFLKKGEKIERKLIISEDTKKFRVFSQFWNNIPAMGRRKGEKGEIFLLSMWMPSEAVPLRTAFALRISPLAGRELLQESNRLKGIEFIYLRRIWKETPADIENIRRVDIIAKLNLIPFVIHGCFFNKN